MSEVAILVLLGTKAQYIKTAPVLREMDRRGIAYNLVYTGQHCETFEVLEAAFGMRSADDILVPRFEASTHSMFLDWTLRYWIAVARRLRSGAWRGMRIGLVHGDTASTLFGAIAIRLAGARVGHIEAGLRAPRLLEPFPEEVVRRTVSRLASWHYVPDAMAANNLHGIPNVVDTGGNTLRDALALALARIPERSQEGGQEGHAVVSMHRSENLSQRAVFDMLLEEVIATAAHVPVKFVLHPATRERLRATGWMPRLQQIPGLELLARMDYPDFVRLLVGASFLMTDGGSNQEEAAMLGLPTLLLRRATERHDGLGANVVLSELSPQTIREFVTVQSGKRWPIRSLKGGSPSAVLVDHLQKLIGT